MDLDFTYSIGLIVLDLTQGHLDLDMVVFNDEWRK
jgi:hypothetical protein